MKMIKTILSKVKPNNLNRLIELRLKRDDLYPFYYGGNKAIKIKKIFEYAINSGYDALVTNGGIQSNHARATALIAAENGMKCKLILHGNPNKKYPLTGNLLLMFLVNAEIKIVEKENISIEMDKAIKDLETEGYNPYYIWGGGHTVEGVDAYVEKMKELKDQCEKINWSPDFIFLASGTGSTQAGLILGAQLLDWKIKIIGISIARDKANGITAIKNIINEYRVKKEINISDSEIDFRDEWTCGGYEKYDTSIKLNIKQLAKETGILLDPTYTGKAFTGMVDILNSGVIPTNSKVLYWHTGGLFNLLTSDMYSGTYI